MKRLWAPWRLKFLLEHSLGRGCVFCDLLKGPDNESTLILARTPHSFVVMNKYPYNSGHLMVVPRKHTACFKDLSDDELLDLAKTVRKATLVLQSGLKCMGLNVGMNLGEAGGAGIRDHMHYHIVPRWNGDTNFMPVLADVKVLPESLEETYRRLASHF